MSDRFDDFTRETLENMKQGAGDVTRHAFADIGNSYQQVLMADASISPSPGLTGSMEQVTVEVDQAQTIATPEIDAERG